MESLVQLFFSCITAQDDIDDAAQWVIDAHFGKKKWMCAFMLFEVNKESWILIGWNLALYGAGGGGVVVASGGVVVVGIGVVV